MANTNTSTQVRTFYADDSSLNIKFYNMRLSLSFYPIASKTAEGLRQYDTSGGKILTIGFEDAAAMSEVIRSIVDGKSAELSFTINGAAGAQLMFDRVLKDGKYISTLSLNRDGSIIPFTFQTTVYTVRENGAPKDIVVESGLLTLRNTLQGYLTGINSDRHLDKLTEDYVKSLGNNNNQNNFQRQSTPRYSAAPSQSQAAKPVEQKQQNFSDFTF